jgi:hypothetical protein
MSRHQRRNDPNRRTEERSYSIFFPSSNFFTIA